MLLPQCKKVFACKVKTSNLFSLQLQQNCLVQQCFLPLFFLYHSRILLKPSYNSCSGAITCTNMIAHRGFRRFSLVYCILRQKRHFSTKFTVNVRLAWCTITASSPLCCQITAILHGLFPFWRHGRGFRPIALTLFSLRQCPATQTLVCCFWKSQRNRSLRSGVPLWKSFGLPPSWKQSDCCLSSWCITSQYFYGVLPLNYDSIFLGWKQPLFFLFYIKNSKLNV